MQRPAQPETPSLIHPIHSIVDRIDVLSLFPRQQPLEVELGAGDGSFLVQYAVAHPERNIFAVERLLGRLRKIDKKGRRLGLTNVRVARIEASYFLEFLLPLESASAVHIYFPDPWPKRKYKVRRLINERFTEVVRKALIPDGVIYLRTDDADYFDQMNRVFDANPAFGKVETPADLLAVKTDFERHFNARGIPTLTVAYRRNS